MVVCKDVNPLGSMYTIRSNLCDFECLEAAAAADSVDGGVGGGLPVTTKVPLVVLKIGEISFIGLLMILSLLAVEVKVDAFK